MNFDDLRARFSAELASAMQAGATDEVRALRSLMNALDNATAVEVPAARPGIPRPTEVPRRELTPDDVDGVLRRERLETEAAAAEYQRLNRLEEAERLGRRLALLGRYQAWADDWRAG